MRLRWRSLCALGAMIVTVAAGAPRAAASNLCTPEELACLENTIDHIPCLEKVHACGLYRELVDYFVEGNHSEEVRAYYLGVAFHGLATRTRSVALRCEYWMAAQTFFYGFLDKKRGELRTDGNFSATFSWSQIHHATKAMDDLADSNECLSSGISALAAKAAATNFLTNTLRYLFVGQPPEGELGDVVKRARVDVQEAIKKFVNTAGDIETKLSILEQELLGSFSRLDKIAALYEGLHDDPALGTVTRARDAQGRLTDISFSIATEGLLFDAKAKAVTLLQEARQRETDLNTALGGLEIGRDYETRRKDLIERARGIVTQASQAINRRGVVAPPVGGAFWQTHEVAKNTDTSRSYETVFKVLQDTWRIQYGRVHGFCDSDPSLWFCNEETP